MRDAIGLGRALLLGVVAAVALGGCGAEFNAYDAYVKDVARVGTVRGDVNGGKVIFTAIDGKSSLGTWKAPTNKVHVLPGIHKFGISLKDSDLRRALRFEVTAGREYLILFKDGTFEVEEVTGRKIHFVETRS